MPGEGVQRNAITYNAAISACEKGDCQQRKKHWSCSQDQNVSFRSLDVSTETTEASFVGRRVANVGGGCWEISGALYFPEEVWYSMTGDGWSNERHGGDSEVGLGMQCAMPSVPVRPPSMRVREGEVGGTMSTSYMARRCWTGGRSQL